MSEFFRWICDAIPKRTQFTPTTNLTDHSKTVSDRVDIVTAARAYPRESASGALNIPFVTDALYADAERYVNNFLLDGAIFVEKFKIFTGVPFKNFNRWSILRSRCLFVNSTSFNSI